MRNLILFFGQYGGPVLFVALELVCLYLIINFNQNQKEIWFNSSNVISAKVSNWRSDISQYYSLSDFADSLAAENARLKAALNNAKFVQTILKDTVVDAENKQMYQYIAARVISSNIHLHHNTFTINRGWRHEIQPDMGVIDSNPQGGIIGIVTNVSEHFSVVMSILHPECRIPATLSKYNYHGILSWQPSDPKRTNMIDVPKHAPISKMDTVMTSTYSGIFPEGILIGTVDTFWQVRGSSFHSIRVKLVNDLSNLRNVYVINNLFKGELDTLQQQNINEQGSNQ